MGVSDEMVAAALHQDFSTGYWCVFLCISDHTAHRSPFARCFLFDHLGFADDHLLTVGYFKFEAGALQQGG
ncbi:hypothetical protein [Chitinophaga sp. HK235]|uniref:hypothetical protein n=1 Tax=Chitinophaga sp. HK235 TaxID=2952571 RepID=UPI0035B44219